MPQGYHTTHAPEIPLARKDIAVHPAARNAFVYFQRFIENRHITPRGDHVASPTLLFVCEDKNGEPLTDEGVALDEEKDDQKEKKRKRYMENRLLVGGFHQFALLPGTGKASCLVVDRELSSDSDIESYAWQEVLPCEPLRPVNSKAIAARIHVLQQWLPKHLVEHFLANDPHETQLTTESLCRAYGVPSDSIRSHMPNIRRGGLTTHSFTKHIAKKDDKDE